MVKFLDGPAATQVLDLRRAPMFLRVVKGPKGWDALDEVNDTPADNEQIFAYRLKGEAGSIHILTRGKGGKRAGGWYALAEYVFWPEQPADQVMRYTNAWRGWCLAMQDKPLPTTTAPRVEESLFGDEVTHG